MYYSIPLHYNKHDVYRSYSCLWLICTSKGTNSVHMYIRRYKYCYMLHTYVLYFRMLQTMNYYKWIY